MYNNKVLTTKISTPIFQKLYNVYTVHICDKFLPNNTFPTMKNYSIYRYHNQTSRRPGDAYLARKIKKELKVDNFNPFMTQKTYFLRLDIVVWGNMTSEQNVLIIIN